MAKNGIFRASKFFRV